MAVIFCDICNFDDIIEQEKENIILYLDNIFREYDKICKENGILKIETVGKTYMASAGLKSCEKEINDQNRKINPALRVNFHQFTL